MTRYDDLLGALPSGSYYQAPSQVLPFRTSAYEFLFEPVTASRTYQVFTNDQYRGVTVANSNGQAIVSLTLTAGKQNIIIVDTVNGDRFAAYCTIKHAATVTAAQAAALESIDDYNEAVRLTFGIETADARLVQEVYGQSLDQPNDLGSWLLPAYHNLMFDLRQAYRLFGAKLKGERQAVLGITSSVPLVVPTAWRPSWYLGYQLLENGDFQARGRVFTDQTQPTGLATLNARALAWVHAAYAGSSPNVFSGPITDPPTPQQLLFRFALGWDSGDVVVFGFDSNGTPLTEVISTVQAQPIAAEEYVGSQYQYAQVTSFEKTVVGAAAAVTVGVYEGRYVKVINISGAQRAGAIELRYLQSGGANYLRWDGGLNPTVDYRIDGAGTYLLGNGAGRRPLIVGLARDTGAGFTIGTNPYLNLEFDRRGPVLIRLDATPIVAADVVTQVNTFFRTDPRYGAVRAEGTITCIPANLFVDGETVTIDDGINPAVVFEFNSGPVTPGNVQVLLVGGESATQVADRLAIAINGVGGPVRGDAGPAGNRLRITATGGNGGNDVTLVNHFGGTAGNVAITDTVANAGFVVVGMATGANGSYGAIAGVETSVAALGTSVVLAGNASTETGPDGQAKVLPVGASATFPVLGLSRYRTTLDANAAFRALSLDCSVGGGPYNQRVPEPTENILLASAIADTATSTAPALQPSSPTALEVIFDGAWRGGAVRIDGLDRDGATISETFADPNLPTASPVNRVATGTLDATSADLGVTVTFATPALLSTAKVGDYFRLTSGASSGQGAFIQRILLSGTVISQAIAGVVLEGAGIGANFTSQSWTVNKMVTTKGAEAFASVSDIVNVTPSGAGDSGSMWLSVIDGESRCVPLWLGRGSLRASGTSAGVPDEVNPTSVASDLAVIGIDGIFTYPQDLGGWLLLSGMEAEGGRNLGLHSVVKSWNFDVTDNAIVIAKHQDGGLYFGQFATEDPFPVGATWALYSAGQRVYAATNNRTTGAITLFPPGVMAPMPTTTTVVDTDELPFTSTGRELGVGVAEVVVDPTYTPTTTPVFESVTVAGATIGDGWTVTNATVDVTPDATGRSVGYLVPRYTLLEGDGVGDITVEKNAPAALQYLGFDIKIDAWVQQHVAAGAENFRIDVDFGAGFSNGANQAVTGTSYDAVFGGARDPTFITRTVRVPYNATECVIRITHVGSGAGDLVRLEKVMVSATFATGLYLADNTIGLSRDQAFFGEVLYAWSPEQLTAAERAALGLPAGLYPEDLSNVGTRLGHIDQISNAQGRWSRYDLTEYAVSSVPENLVGAYDDAAWALATLTNLEVVIGTPPRTSYLAPSRVSLVELEGLTIGAPSNATLDEPYTAVAPFPATPADDEQLFEYPASGEYPDGLIVPSSPSVTGGVLPWRFIAANAVQIASVAAGDPANQAVYDPTSSYRLTYRTLIQAQTAVLDLGASFADYLWLYDAAIFQRKQPGTATFVREQQLTFASDYRAALSVPSDQVRVTTTVVRDDGIVRSTVDPSNWRYIDATSIEIRPNAFSPDAVYSVTYAALEPTYTSPTTITLEGRSASTSVGVAAATYEEFQIDQVVDQANQYHQLRVTISGVVDVRDVRVYSLGLRGLPIWATPPIAPGIVLP